FRDCGTVDSASFSVEIQGIGLAATSAQTLKIRPNPAQNWIQHEGPECTNVRLHSSTGQVVEVRSHWRAYEPWNLEALPNGVYFVETDRGWSQFVLFR
ncbi:MAG: T9SS type A sorting domain-containing protein, partial [Schleiferiaceae bacterium]